MGPAEHHNRSNNGYLLLNTEILDEDQIVYGIEMYGHKAGEIRLYVRIPFYSLKWIQMIRLDIIFWNIKGLKINITKFIEAEKF